MTDGNGFLGRIGALMRQRGGGANAWARAVALLGVVAVACGEPGTESALTETVAKAQEALVDTNAPLAPGERRGTRTMRLNWGGPPMNASTFDLSASLNTISALGSGTAAVVHAGSYPSSGYWIAHKNSPNQGEWVSHLLKAKMPPPPVWGAIYNFDGAALWLTHSLFIPTGTAGPGGAIALDPPGLTNGQGFVQPAPEGGALLNPVVSAPGSGVDGTRWRWTNGPADTGVAVRVADQHLLRLGILPNQIIQQSFLVEIAVAVPSHPERAGAVIGNAIRPLMFLQRGGQNLVTSGSGIQLSPVDFSAHLDKWAWLQVRADVTTFGGTAASSSDDVVRVKYRSYLEGQLVHTEEPTIDASVVQAQAGPIFMGPGFALLRGYQGDAPEAFIDELQIYVIVGPTALRAGESLGPTQWTETFGNRNDGAGDSLSGFKFVPYNTLPDRSVRLHDPTTAQASGTTMIAYKGNANTEVITQHIPHFAPGANCTTNPLSADCRLPNGSSFDGTAMWITHSRFVPPEPNALTNCVPPGGGVPAISPPPIGCASAPALGRRYDGTDAPADIGAYVRPADNLLFEIPFQNGATLRKSYVVSADLYVPTHVGGHEWIRIIPYARRGPHVDPAWAHGLETNLLGIANKWNRLDVRVDVTTHGGGVGTADDKAEVYLQYVVDTDTGGHKSFSGAYVNLDAISAAGSSENLKFGVSYGVLRGWQLDALEAFLDNISVHEIVGGHQACDDSTPCPSGQACGVNNGTAFGLSSTTRVCWDPTCDTAATEHCGGPGATCGFCPTGVECSADADCAFGLTCRENGRHYDKPYGASVCAPEICETDPVTGGCGTVASPCGKCEPNPTACVTNADCGATEVCGVDNGDAFGMSPGNDYCWPPVCNEPATTSEHCGTVASECGTCDCSANCAGKACGDDPSDGCGGTCDLCSECATDLDCPTGDSCGVNAGPYFGLPAGTNVCWPLACNDVDPQLPNCGIANAECGTCGECVPNCNGRECGSDGCGGTCGGCWTGETCNPVGECVLAADAAYALIHAEDFPEPLPDASTAGVGTLNGSFSVTDRGAANYTIPIEVPPARAGFQPELAIAYDGSKSEGLLGPGWRVSGFSVIARCPQTVASHGSNQPVSYSTLTFCLDGQPLMEQSAPSGSPDRDFRTEVDGFSRIIGRGVTYHSGEGSSAGYTGPQFFEVLTKDGRTLTYGASDQASASSHGAKRLWALEKIRDRAGNIITITYYPHRIIHDIDITPLGGWPDTGELRPKSIVYGGNENGAPANLWVNFDYEPRPDPVHHYVDGARGFSLQRLTAVTTFAAGLAARRYEVGYPAVGTTRLESVRECTGDGDVCKPSTTFEYVVGAERNTTVPTVVFTPFSITGIMDQDGDGSADLLAEDTVFRTRFQANGELTWDRLDVPSYNAQSALVSDVNADGRDDIVSPFGTVLTSTANGFTTESFSSPHGGSVPLGNALLADVDGDGLQELVTIPPQGTPVRIFQNSNGQFQSPTAHDDLPTGKCVRLLAIDTNGDKAQEILCLPENGTVAQIRSMRTIEGLQVWSEDTPIPGGHVLKILDINGDGLDDALAVDASAGVGQPVLWQSTGRTFLPRQITIHLGPGLPSEDHPDPLHIPAADLADAVAFDRDGDGRDDLFRTASSTATDKPSVIYRSVGRYELEANLGPPIRQPRLGDIDGDGNTDIVGRGHTGDCVCPPEPAPCGCIPTSSATIFPVVHGYAQAQGLLASVTNGHGMRVDVRYEARTIDLVASGPRSTYVPTPCSGIVEEMGVPGTAACVGRVPPLVSEHIETIPAGQGVQRGERAVYTYRAGRRGLGGRGFFGFTNRQVTYLDADDEISRTTDVEYYTTDFVRAGIPRIARTTFAPVPESTLSASQRTAIHNEFEFSVATSASGRPFAKIVSSTQDTEELIPGTQLYALLTRNRSTFNIDSWGNVETHTAQTLSGNTSPPSIVDTTVKHVTYYPEEVEPWRIGLPATVTLTSARGGSSRSRRTRFEYYPSGLLETIAREPEDSYLQLTTVLSRNEYGAIWKIASTDSDESSRARTIVYDWDDRLPVSIENALGHVTEVDFHPASGRLRTSASPNRVFQQLAYDGLGRIREQRSPDGQLNIAYSSAAPIESAQLGLLPAVTRTSVVPTAGGEESYEADAFGRVVRTTAVGFEGQLIETEVTYDWAHRVYDVAAPHAEDDVSQGLTSYRYDPAGRLSTITSADGSTTQRLYASSVTRNTAFAPWMPGDAFAIVATVHPRGNVEARALTHDGQPVRSIESEGLLQAQVQEAHWTGMRYESFGLRTEIFDQLGNVTSLVRDGLGRVSDITDPDSGDEHRVFSAWGEPIEVTDAKGDVRALEYDALGRLTRILSRDEEIVAEWIYDGTESANEVGRLLESYRQDAPGSAIGNRTTYSYESAEPGLANAGRLERVEREIQDAAGALDIFATSFDYDEFGRLEVLTYPAIPGGTVGAPATRLKVRHEYDDDSGMLVAVSEDATDGITYWQMTQTDQGFRPTHEQYGEIVETVAEYYSLDMPDPECRTSGDLSCLPGRLRSLQTADLQDLRLQYDRNGNVKTRSNSGGADREMFSYDGFDQLKTHTRQIGTLTHLVGSYSYDALGNLESKSFLGMYAYNGGRPHAVSSVGATAYAYDANGNQEVRDGPLVPGGYQRLYYNDFDMPYRITTGEEGAAFETEIEYDAFERRVAKRSAALSIRYVGDIYEERASASQAEHRHKIFANDRQVAEVSKVETNGVTGPATTLYLLEDHLGSASVVVNSSGVEVDRRNYDPFGGGVDIEGSVTRGFTGHEHDEELGLINMRGRLYDPTLGQFIQPDPFVTTLNPRGLNRYAYVLNNPLIYVDPTGFIMGWGNKGPLDRNPVGEAVDDVGEQSDDKEQHDFSGLFEEFVDLTDVREYGIQSGGVSAPGRGGGAPGASGGSAGASSVSPGPVPGDVTVTVLPGPSPQAPNYGPGGGVTGPMGRQSGPGSGVGLGGRNLLGTPPAAAAAAACAANPAECAVAVVAGPWLLPAATAAAAVAATLWIWKAVSDESTEDDKTKAEGKRFTPDQEIVVEWAKEADRIGLSDEDAEALMDLAKKVRLPVDDHRDTDHWVGGPHIRIGPYRHIPVR